MTIICLHPMKREDDLPFEVNPYNAWIEPAYAGAHPAEVILYISDSDLKYYDVPVFDDYHKACNSVFQECFGQDAYEVEEGE